MSILGALGGGFLGQIEVYEWLKLQRVTGDDRFFSVREIERGIQGCGLFNGNWRGVWAAVVALESYGYLDVRRKGHMRDFRRVVRLKRKFCVGGVHG